MKKYRPRVSGAGSGARLAAGLAPGHALQSGGDDLSYAIPLKEFDLAGYTSAATVQAGEATTAALAPIMWSAGAGADVMKRIAAPMIGGIFTSFLLELAVYPAIYEVWKWRSVKPQSV